MESQFNWIYVLIIGAVVIAFFFGFAYKQKQSSESANAITISSNMKSIFTVARSNVDSASSAKLLGKTMIYSCNEGFPEIKIDSASNSLPGVVVFAPKLLQGDEVYVWTQSWFAPYKVDNFLYVSSPKTLYYFVYNGTSNAKLGNKINKSLPDVFNAIIDNKLDWSNVVDDNYDNIKVIFIGVSHSTLSTLASGSGIFFPYIGDTKFSVMSIESFANTDDEIGKVYYHSIGIDNKLNVALVANNTEYIGYASLLASVFSDDKNDYECGMNVAFDKMIKVTDYLYNRTDYFKSKLGTAPSLNSLRCGDSIDLILSYLDSNNNALTASTDFVTKVNLLANKYNDLNYQNSYLESNSCPLTY